MSKDLSHKKKHLFVQDPDLASDYNSGVNGKTAGTGTAAGSTIHTSHHSSKILGKLTFFHLFEWMRLLDVSNVVFAHHIIFTNSTNGENFESKNQVGGLNDHSMVCLA